MAANRDDGNTDYIDRQDQSQGIGNADGRRTNNRYIAAQSSEESTNETNASRTLLNIMREEFPDDPLYSTGRLTPGSQAQQTREGFTIPEETRRDMLISKRNEKNIVMINSEKEEYTSYEMKKMYPTVDEEVLDDLIDEEWESFEDADEEDPEEIVPPGISGLFLVNQEKDREDFHHLYITRGPQHLLSGGEDADDMAFEDVFCGSNLEKMPFYVISGNHDHRVRLHLTKSHLQ